ncbi:hypothetical protein [Capsulimonas corticalis]
MDKAASRGLIDLPQAITLLRNTTFRADRSLIETLLANDASRKKQP